MYDEINLSPNTPEAVYVDARTGQPIEAHRDTTGDACRLIEESGRWRRRYERLRDAFVSGRDSPTSDDNWVLLVADAIAAIEAEIATPPPSE